MRLPMAGRIEKHSARCLPVWMGLAGKGTANLAALYATGPAQAQQHCCMGFP